MFRCLGRLDREVLMYGLCSQATSPEWMGGMRGIKETEQQGGRGIQGGYETVKVVEVE